MGDFREELTDEVQDFFEDLWDRLAKGKPSVPKWEKKMAVGGVVTTVRPAYLFAERVDNLLKLLFAVSIVISGVTATFLGFTKLSDLLAYLIATWWGRVLMVAIGGSYTLTALWKLLNLGSRTPGSRSKGSA